MFSNLASKQCIYQATFYFSYHVNVFNFGQVFNYVISNKVKSQNSQILQSYKIKVAADDRCVGALFTKQQNFCIVQIESIYR